MSKKAMLIIMDGWGHGKVPSADAVKNAHPEFVNSLYAKYPNTELITCGEAVGLPDGQMGNSEVGHLNIGAGRIVYQELERINVAIRNGEMAQNETLLQAFKIANERKCTLHLIGLVSDGGVHSHLNHIKALCSLAQEYMVQEVMIHAFTDGRDTDPKSGLGYLKDLQNYILHTGAKLASVCGRYYAMDRDKRWERVKLAYDALVHGVGTKTNDPLTAIMQSYESNVTDEFIKPIIVTDANNMPLATIKDGDVVLCFNFRTDRCREITQALTQQAFPEQLMVPLNLHYVTMTEYDKSYKNVHVIFENKDLKQTIGEVLEEHGKTQIRIAETEKYPHVTFFFSGGREKEFTGEKRIMIPSPKVATYDLQPEMSAKEVTEAIVPEINSQRYDFICLNYANIDMVGHTGVYSAAVKAIETIDTCLNNLVAAGLKNGYSFIIIADHGNADCMVNADGTPNTAHTTNPVPCIVIDPFVKKVNDGRLADIAPSVLKLMGLESPQEMTGKPLF